MTNTKWQFIVTLVATSIILGLAITSIFDYNKGAAIFYTIFWIAFLALVATVGFEYNKETEKTKKEDQMREKAMEKLLMLAQGKEEKKEEKHIDVKV
jgi:hypothetical protein